MGARAVYRLIILMLAALLAFAAAAAYIGWRNMREENTELELGRMRLEEQKAALEAEKAYKQEYFSRLVYDEEFAARIIREKLGFADPDEIIFRFEDSSPTASDMLGNAAADSETAPEIRTPAERPRATARPICAQLFWTGFSPAPQPVREEQVPKPKAAARKRRRPRKFPIRKPARWNPRRTRPPRSQDAGTTAE